MGKTIKVIAILMGLLLVGFMARCFYMIACISCTTPSIKTYSYDGSMDKFENEFKKFISSNPNMNCQFTPRGNDNNDARDFVVKINTSASVLKYDMILYDFNENTKVDLAEIHDETHKTGGNNVDSLGVKMLYDDFRKTFLAEMEKQQGIVLKPDFFNF